MKQKSTKQAEKGFSDVVDAEVKEVKREWRHFLKFRDENRLLFTAFVIVLTAIVVVNTIYIVSHVNTDKSDSSPATAQPNPNLVLTTLETGTNGAEQARISSVTENAKTDYAFTIDPNQTMLIMNIKITNKTAETQHLIPSSQFYVRSDEGDYSSLHASMYVTTPLSATDLKPGQSASGQISFAVPTSVARPLLYVDTGWNSYTPLVFDVLH